MMSAGKRGNFKIVATITRDGDVHGYQQSGWHTHPQVMHHLRGLPRCVAVIVKRRRADDASIVWKRGGSWWWDLQTYPTVEAATMFAALTSGKP